MEQFERKRQDTEGDRGEIDLSRQSLTLSDFERTLRYAHEHLQNGGPAVDRDLIARWRNNELNVEEDTKTSLLIGTFRAWNEAYTDHLLKLAAPIVPDESY